MGNVHKTQIPVRYYTIQNLKLQRQQPKVSIFNWKISTGMSGSSEILEACSNGRDEDFRQTTTRQRKSKRGMSQALIVTFFSGGKFRIKAFRGFYGPYYLDNVCNNNFCE